MNQHNFDAKRIANLASLHVNDDEVSALNEKVERILASMGKLQQLDTTGIEPLNSPLEYCTPLREDVISEQNEREVLQDLAPQVSAGLYIVPQVIASDNDK
jgi:aspartyl-tRNA(Asn)/glutamyl-tRNA(Gln) amidotransferase subunit C